MTCLPFIFQLLKRELERAEVSSTSLAARRARVLVARGLRLSKQRQCTRTASCNLTSKSKLQNKLFFNFSIFSFLQILPRRIDWEGNSHTQTFEELVRKKNEKIFFLEFEKMAVLFGQVFFLQISRRGWGWVIEGAGGLFIRYVNFLFHPHLPWRAMLLHLGNRHIPSLRSANETNGRGHFG